MKCARCRNTFRFDCICQVNIALFITNKRERKVSEPKSAFCTLISTCNIFLVIVVFNMFNNPRLKGRPLLVNASSFFPVDLQQ